MKSRLTIWFSVTCTLLLVCVQTQATDNRAQSAVNSIGKALESYQVFKVEIVQVPGYVEARTQFDSKGLEDRFYYKVTIADIRTNPYRADLIAAIKSTTADSRQTSVDLRWGVIFYNEDGTRVGAIFFDSSGRHGAVNDEPVNFNGIWSNSLFAWLKDNFGNCLR
jgi:hypothetical protein